MANNVSIKTTLYDSFDQLESVWKSIEEQSDCYAFQSFAWLKNWYALIGIQSDLRVCIVLAENPAGRPLMLLPLGIQRRGRISCLVWLGGKISDYHGPLLGLDCDELFTSKSFESFWQDVQAKLPHFDAISFEKQPERIGRQRNPFLYLNCKPNASSAHSTNLFGPIDAFIKSKRSSKSINTEKRKRKRLEKKGKLDFIVAKKEDEISCLLSEMIRQKVQSYRELGVNNLFEKKGHREFFEYMSTHYISDSFVFLCALTQNHRVLATHWGLVYKRRFYHLFPTYERGELTRLSPGNMLLLKMFQWSVENGCETYDFTGGDEPYKFLWRDTELKLYDYVHAVNMKGRLFIVPIGVLRWLKRKIKHSPMLWRVVTFFRARRAQFGF